MASYACLQRVSYLQARDPSILSSNRPNLDNIRVNLQEKLLNPEDERNDDSIGVYLRIKKENDWPDLYEIAENTLICLVPEESHVHRSVKQGEKIRKEFNFSQIFGPEIGQQELFNTVVKPKIVKLLNGYNSTIMTYGTSGSGKTFTLIGTDQDPGLLPQALEYLFRTLRMPAEDSVFLKPLPTGEVVLLDNINMKQEILFRNNIINHSIISVRERHQNITIYHKMSERLSSVQPAFLEKIPDVNVSVWVSFAEIYNENIYDLLQPPPTRGKQRPRLCLGNSNGFNFVKNLCSVYVTNGLEAFQILQYGLHNLKYAETLLNVHSSRSHAIFTIKIVQHSPSEGEQFVNYLNFCDLAGAERSKKTQNVGIRQQESKNINTSLLVLGRCIQASRLAQTNTDDNTVFPFRESKLTQLFQRALCGNEDIAMIVNISPLKEMFDETHHVLNFSAIAKDIKIITKPLPRKNNRFSQYLQTKRLSGNPTIHHTDNTQELLNVIDELQIQLQEQQMENEHIEQSTRTRVIEGYKEILELEKKNWEETLENEKRRITFMYEEKIEMLSRQYKSQEINDNDNERDGDASVIVIDSDSDDSLNASHECDCNSNDDIANKFDVAIISQKLVDAESRCKNLEKQNIEYVRILEDAKNDYEQLEKDYQERCCELTAKIVRLTEQNYELDKELNELRRTY